MKALTIVTPLAVICAVGVFLVLTNHNIPFANVGNCDPWHFWGRFYIGDQLATLSHTRDSGRTPGSIIGFTAVHLFHGIKADYANFLALLLGAGGAVYFAARRLFGTWPAAAAGIFIVTQPLIIGNFSVTHSAPSVAYSAIAMAFAVIAATMANKARRDLVIVAAGFFWAAALHAHLYSLTVNFITTLYCLDWCRRPSWRFAGDAVWRWLLLFGGAVVATAFFGAITALVYHGNFFFFMDQYNAIASVNVVDYIKPNWYLLGGRGAFVILGLALSVAQLLWLRHAAVSPTVKRLHLTALIPYAVLEVAQVAFTGTGRGMTWSDDYYFVWMLAPLSLLIASFVARVQPSRVQALAAAGLFLVACLAADFGRLDLLWQSSTTFPPSIAVAILLVIAVFLIARAPMPSIIATLALLALLNATTRPDKLGIAVWAQGYDGRDVHRRLDSGMAFLATFHFATIPKFWSNITGPMWESVAYPRAYDYCLSDTAMPGFTPPNNPGYRPGAENFSKGDYFVMVPTDSNALAAALQSLSSKGLRFHELGRKAITSSALSYLIVVGQLD